MESKVESIAALGEIDLFERVKSVYETAEANGDLVYKKPSFEEVVKDEETGLEYEMKIVEALGVRPNNRAVEPGTGEKVTSTHVEEVQKKNPFLKPEPELTVVDNLLEDYRLILNKYPNTRYHMLLVTREFVAQDTLLKPIELLLVRTILENLNGALAKQGACTKYFAFFNSGPESGYSQYHKHIQFMLLPDNFRAFPEDLVKDVDFYLPNEIEERKGPKFNTKCTFKHSVLKLAPLTGDQEEDEDNLAFLYMFLVKRALNVCKEFGVETMSYNLVMVGQSVMVVPRRAAKYEGIWQNALGFLGIFNAKNTQVRDNIVNVGFTTILKECGFPMDKREEDVVYNEYGY